MQVVEEYLEIDIAVVLQRTNETHLESIDSYKNAILSVYFYKKNSVFFVLWIQLYLKIKGLINSPDN
ncbi:hypothetical protein CN450_24880 [Bacillus cereus]|nr:hypothetical protein CN450_24880 [Bacillus cereus]